MDGFRSLRLGEAVEFNVEEADGRIKAIDVTGPGGAPPQVCDTHVTQAVRVYGVGGCVGVVYINNPHTGSPPKGSTKRQW